LLANAIIPPLFPLALELELIPIAPNPEFVLNLEMVSIKYVSLEFT
jgi:hypothetical protein